MFFSTKRHSYGLTIISLILIGNLLLFPKATPRLGPSVAEAFSTSVASNSTDIDLSNQLYIDEDLNQLVYVVQNGDTLSTIAQEFGVTVGDLKNANDLTSDSLKIGQKLQISEQQGFIITPEKNINVKEFAVNYGIDYEKLKSANYLTDSDTTVDAGTEFFIPLSEKEGMEKGILKKLEKNNVVDAGETQPVAPKSVVKAVEKKPAAVVKTPVAVKPQPTKPTVAKQSEPVISKPLTNRAFNSKIRNGFAVGYCTWYVAARKFPMAGENKQKRLWGGNAIAWYNNAKAAGYSVGKTPKVGAIIVLKYPGSYYSRYGHVGIVKAVNGDKVVVESMNYTRPFVVSTHTEPASGGSTIGYIYL